MSEDVVVRAWPGGVGENVTGAQVTDLAETSTGYLTAFSDIGKGASSRIGRDISNIYLSYTDKSDFSERGTTVRQITNFSASSTEFGSQPRLVPTGLDGGYILWDMAAKEDNVYFYNNGTLQYARYSADGTVSTVQTSANTPLSDCQPIEYNGQVVWYVTDGFAPTFYTLDNTGVTALPTAGGAEQPEEIPEPVPTSTPEPSDGPEVQSSAGGNHTIAMGAAVMEDGSLVAWGTGKEEWNEEPEVLGSGFVAVSQYDVNFLALKRDGTLWSWGHGKGHAFPDELVKVLDGVRQISGPLALEEDGTVWFAEAESYEDQLAGNFGYYITDNAKQVSFDGQTCVILKNDGVVYTTSMYPEAGQFPLERVLDQVTYVSGFTAIRSDGTLWSRGDRGSFGIRGDGSSSTGLAPTKILDSMVNVWAENANSMSNGSAFAMTADGSLYSWGFNSVGQLGYSGGNQMYKFDLYGTGNVQSLPYQDIPRRVEISGAADVSSCMLTTLVLKSDGTLWAVGSNSNCQALLPADTETVSSFTQVLSGVMLPDGAAAEAGLMNGTGSGRFSPAQSLSLAEVVTLTARLFAEDHGEAVPASLSGEPWYQAAYDYCVGSGLFTATRFEMVELLDRAVPDIQKAPIHSTAAVPDLAESAVYGDVVYRWYRAGITRGDQEGNFNGSSPITRAETAAILCRLAGLAERV